MNLTKHLLFLMLCTPILLHAQYDRADLWRAKVNKFQEIDGKGTTPSDVVLFIGSSTFTGWTGVKNDFPNSKVLNRAFGGSTMRDLIHFFNQIVLPYNPKQIVIYEGDNDLADVAKTPEEYLADVSCMIHLIRMYYPEIPIVMVSVKPSPLRTSIFEKYRKSNSLVRKYVKSQKNMSFVDIWNPMFDKNNKPDSSYFIEDQLHLSPKGYELCRSLLEPLLIIEHH